MNPSQSNPRACRLQNVPIVPVGLADVSGSTSLFASYLARAPGWTLGTGASLAWGRCVKRNHRGVRRGCRHDGRHALCHLVRAPPKPPAPTTP